jgi:hypothetical protein
MKVRERKIKSIKNILKDNTKERKECGSRTIVSVKFHCFLHLKMLNFKNGKGKK